MTKFKLATVLVLMTFSPLSIAGIYTDNLSDCLLSSTTEEDKLRLVKWMFTAISLHPAVTTLAEVSKQTRDEANKGMAELLVELLTDRCVDQTREAIQNEGSLALQTSFSVLGQVAATNLFSDPNVAAGLSSLEQFVNIQDLDRRLEIGQ